MTRGGKRALVALAMLGLLAGGAVVALPPLLFGDGVDYSQVVSIAKTPEYQDAALLDRAWQAAARFKPGMEYQHNGSFCGPTSAVVVAHSLGAAATQGDILDGTAVHSTWGMVFGGVTLDELAGVVRERLHKNVTVLRDLDLAQFRAELSHANDPDRRYIVNFHRGPLFGRGGGHHSPIGAYLADRDLVLVLDVNEKYHPWLVSSERLWNAVNTVDKQTHQKRGLLLIQ
jgi:Phytochelatin synthase